MNSALFSALFRPLPAPPGFSGPGAAPPPHLAVLLPPHCCPSFTSPPQPLPRASVHLDLGSRALPCGLPLALSLPTGDGTKPLPLLLDGALGTPELPALQSQTTYRGHSGPCPWSRLSKVYCVACTKTRGQPPMGWSQRREGKEARPQLARSPRVPEQGTKEWEVLNSNLPSRVLTKGYSSQ